MTLFFIGTKIQNFSHNKYNIHKKVAKWHYLYEPYPGVEDPWVSLHNGGGVGWGEVINGGFGMVIDGSDEADRRIRQMLLWDVNNGIARRSWARNGGSMDAIRREMERTPGLQVTMPNLVDDALLED